VNHVKCDAAVRQLPEKGLARQGGTATQVAPFPLHPRIETPVRQFSEGWPYDGVSNPIPEIMAGRKLNASTADLPTAFTRSV